jgi:hypothetical protein
MRTVAILLLLSSSALAQDAGVPTVGERLTRARAAEANLEYQVAADELLAVISDPQATPPELLEANLRAGIVQRVLGNDVEARLHFVYVFQRMPDAELPAGQPPKIAAFFELVRQEVIGAQRPAPVPQPPPEPAAEPEIETRKVAPEGKVRAVPTRRPLLDRPLFLAGGAALGVGLVATGAMIALAAIGESTYADADLETDARKDGQLYGQGGWIGAIAGGSVAAVGAGLMGVALLE